MSADAAALTGVSAAIETGIEIGLEIGYGRLAARAWGNPASPPILAVHGWLDNAASFDALAPLLAQGHYVVALDLAGHGRSAHRARGNWYHHVDNLSDMLEAANVLGWTRFGLLGHSMGAGLASLLAAALPERIDSLWLIEGLGPPTGDQDQALVQLQRALGQHEKAASKSLRVFGDIEHAMQARMQAPGLAISRPAAEVLVPRGLRDVDGGYSWSSDQRLTLASPVRYSETQILAMLRGVTTPTVLVIAEPAMPYFKPEVIAARVAAVAHIRVERVAGTHHLHLEQPGVVASLLLR